jgi:tetratricopeptide (TPR) repeat protein
MQVAAWCARCVNDDPDAHYVADLDLYLQLLQQAYRAPVADVVRAASARRSAVTETTHDRRLWGSAYLGAVVPDSPEVHNVLGLVHMRAGRVDAAIGEFEAALARDAGSANARANLGQLRYEQGVALMDSRRFNEAEPVLRMTIDLLPDSAEAENDLGVTLASMGRIAEALPHFERAVVLKPDFTEARRNRAAAQGQGTNGGKRSGS